jgi:hypothetical protein
VEANKQSETKAVGEKLLVKSSLKQQNTNKSFWRFVSFG